MSPLFISSIAVVANVTGAGMIVPQVVRLHRLRGVDGVSAVWIGIGLALNLCWLGYALDRELIALVPVSILSAGLYAAMTMLYIRITGARSLTRLVGGFTVAAAAPLVAVVANGWQLAGIVLGLAYTIQFTPAAWSALRAPSLAGVSPATWLLAWVEAVAWLGYGLLLSDPAIVLGGAGGAVMSTVILLVLTAERHSSSGLRLA